MFTIIRKSALATTSALSLLIVVAPAEAALNDWPDLNGEFAWLTEMHAAIDHDDPGVKQGGPGTIMMVQDRPADADNRDRADDRAKDAASSAADAASSAADAATAAATAAAADAIFERGASTAAERGLARRAGAAARTAVSKAVDATFAAADAAKTIAKATGKGAAASAATAAEVAKKTAETALIAATDATNVAVPVVVRCTVHAGHGVTNAVTKHLKQLAGTDKFVDPESRQAYEKQNHTGTSNDYVEYICETASEVGATFALRRLF